MSVQDINPHLQLALDIAIHHQIEDVLDPHPIVIDILVLVIMAIAQYHEGDINKKKREIHFETATFMHTLLWNVVLQCQP